MSISFMFFFCTWLYPINCPPPLSLVLSPLVILIKVSHLNCDWLRADDSHLQGFWRWGGCSISLRGENACLLHMHCSYKYTQRHIHTYAYTYTHSFSPTVRCKLSWVKHSRRKKPELKKILCISQEVERRGSIFSHLSFSVSLSPIPPWILPEPDSQKDRERVVGNRERKRRGESFCMPFS